MKIFFPNASSIPSETGNAKNAVLAEVRGRTSEVGSFERLPGARFGHDLAWDAWQAAREEILGRVPAESDDEVWWHYQGAAASKQSASGLSAQLALLLVFLRNHSARRWHVERLGFRSIVATAVIERDGTIGPVEDLQTKLRVQVPPSERPLLFLAPYTARREFELLTQSERSGFVEAIFRRDLRLPMAAPNEARLIWVERSQLAALLRWCAFGPPRRWGLLIATSTVLLVGLLGMAAHRQWPRHAPAKLVMVPAIRQTEVGPLDTKQLDRVLSELSQHVLVNLRKADGSIQVLVDDPKWKSQAWTTAQVLTGILAGPPHTIRDFKRPIWDAAQFVEAARNPNGGGWQKYPNEGPSILEPTAWATILYARLASQAGIWTDVERSWARAACERSLRDLLTYQDDSGGGFRTIFGTQGNPAYAYSAAMALLALLESMDAGIYRPPQIKDPLELAISWLSKRASLEGNQCRFHAYPNTQLAEEPIGLTAQILYTLARAESRGYTAATRECERRFFAELVQSTIDLRSDASFLIIEPGYAKGMRMMWYPWTLLWVRARRSNPNDLSSADLKQVEERLLDGHLIQTLISTFGKDETFRIGETMIALGPAVVP